MHKKLEHDLNVNTPCIDPLSMSLDHTAKSHLHYVNLQDDNSQKMTTKLMNILRIQDFIFKHEKSVK